MPAGEKREREMEISMTINTAAHIIDYSPVHRLAECPVMFSHTYEVFYDSLENTAFQFH